MEVGPFLSLRLLLLHHHAVSLGEAVVPDAGHLPGDLEAGTAARDGKGVFRDLPGYVEGGKLPDRGKL